MRFKKLFQNLDYWLIIAVCLLSLFGIISIASATRINLGASATEVIKQAVFSLIGIVLMLVAANVDYEYFAQFFIPIYILNLLLLLAVLLFGTNFNNATRWISIGPLTIQPSEFAKVIMIFCLARLISLKQRSISEIPMLALLCAFVAVPIVLIQKEPALSASLVLLAIFCIELFVAGLDYQIIRNVVVVAGCAADIMGRQPRKPAVYG